MSSSCPSYSQSCSMNCCDVYGSCPISSSSCYNYYDSYYYSSSSLPLGAIIGIVCGIVAFVVVISLSVYCRRRRLQEMAMRNQMALGQKMMIAQNMNAMNGPSYNPMMNQPPMMQPMMGAPYGMDPMGMGGPIGNPMGMGGPMMY